MCLPDNVLECKSKDVSIMLHAEVDCGHRTVYKCNHMCSLEGRRKVLKHQSLNLSLHPQPSNLTPEIEPASISLKIQNRC